MKDPKDLLFEFNGKEDISPIKRNSQEKKKSQADTSDKMDEVMEVIKKSKVKVPGKLHNITHQFKETAVRK